MPSVIIKYVPIFDILYKNLVRSDGPPKYYEIGDVYYNTTTDELEVYTRNNEWVPLLKPSTSIITMKLVNKLVQYGNVKILENGNIAVKTDLDKIDIIMDTIMYEIENCKFYLLDNNEEKYIKMAYKIKIDNNDVILEKDRLDD